MMEDRRLEGASPALNAGKSRLLAARIGQVRREAVGRQRWLVGDMETKAIEMSSARKHMEIRHACQALVAVVEEVLANLEDGYLPRYDVSTSSSEATQPMRMWTLLLPLRLRLLPMNVEAEPVELGAEGCCYSLVVGESRMVMMIRLVHLVHSVRSVHLLSRNALATLIGEEALES